MFVIRNIGKIAEIVLESDKKVPSLVNFLQDSMCPHSSQEMVLTVHKNNNIRVSSLPSTVTGATVASMLLVSTGTPVVPGWFVATFDDFSVLGSFVSEATVVVLRGVGCGTKESFVFMD